MISMLRLHLHIFRIPRRARLQLVGRFLIRSIQRSAYFPSQAAALTSLVFGEIAGYFVEFGAVSQLRQCFFFLGVFLALDLQLVSLSMHMGGGENDVPGCDGY